MKFSFHWRGMKTDPSLEWGSVFFVNLTQEPGQARLASYECVVPPYSHQNVNVRLLPGAGRSCVSRVALVSGATEVTKCTGVLLLLFLRAVGGCCCVLRAGGTGRASKPKVQIFSLILTRSSLTLRTWQGKWAFILFFFLKHSTSWIQKGCSHMEGLEERLPRTEEVG